MYLYLFPPSTAPKNDIPVVPGGIGEILMKSFIVHLHFHPGRWSGTGKGQASLNGRGVGQPLDEAMAAA
jgi:hypothetical protein